MPYIQLDIDSIPEMEAVARLTGLTFDQVLGGLTRLWVHCWRRKLTHVTTERLLSSFSSHPSNLLSALVECQFVDRSTGPVEFLVRGAEKRLGVLKARSEGGKKAKNNLKQYSGTSPAGLRVAAGSLPDDSRLEPEVEPEGSSGSAPGLTPRNPETHKEEKETNKEKEPAPVAPESVVPKVLDSLPSDSKLEPNWEHIDRVVAHYVGSMRQAGVQVHETKKSTKKRRELVKKALVENEPQRLLDAIDGLTWSDFHRGNGFTGLQYAIGSDERIEQNLQRLAQAHKPKVVKL